MIFYQINEDEKIVLVKAVFHTSQDPEKYKYF
ncbi:MAG: type II toxin-antitoxin system RelE/ParE family toxin [Dysgonamonadaceae bacterium]|nr:type II toxin-antitoxin system RelE/ParE family toxin [Dysgonamonadaceae bacterium]